MAKGGMKKTVLKTDRQIMIGSLKEHLHTQECIPLIREYQKCHKENKFLKFFGVCNELEATMKRCVDKEIPSLKPDQADNYGAMGYLVIQKRPNMLKMKQAMNKTLKGPRRPNVIEREVK